MAASLIDDALGGSLCDAPNYLLLVDGVDGRVEFRHGALFSSTDPESLGKALALAIAQETYGDAIKALVAVGWTFHTPVGSSVTACSLFGVVRNTDAWVVVGYAPAWRTAQTFSGIKGRIQQRTLQVMNKSPVVVSGVGPPSDNHTPHRDYAVDVAPTAASTYLLLRLLKLV